MKLSNYYPVITTASDYNGLRMIKKNYSGGSLSNTVISWTPSYETKAIVGGSTEAIVYYYANGELVARKNNDGTKTYYHTDHLGSTSILTNQAGSLVEATTYDPFGKVLSGGTQSRFQYTGKEKDAETGLNYYESRYYSSDIRRFAQPDSWLPDVYDPQQLNRYSYANNNPLRYVDPTGHCWGDFLGKICNNVSNAVKSAFSSPAPRPASTAKLPNNTPNTPVNLSNQNGNKPAVYTNERKDPSPIANYFKDVQNNGHVDANASVAKVVSFGGGVKLNKSGTTQYISAGGPSQSLGGSFLLSTNSVKQNSVSHNININLIVATQFSYDPSDPFNIEKIKNEAWGVGCCGIDLSEEYTGHTQPYSNPMPSFLSKPLKEVYYGR